MSLFFRKLRLYGVFLLFLCTVSSFGQGSSEPVVKPDPRLYDCFGSQYVNEILNNPRLVAYYNLFLDSAYFVGKEVAAKPVTGEDIYKVKLKKQNDTDPDTYFSENVENFNPRTFNALKYEFRIDPEKYTQYKLGNTGKVLIFYSQKRFSEKYNQYLKSLNLAPVK